MDAIKMPISASRVKRMEGYKYCLLTVSSSSQSAHMHRYTYIKTPEICEGCLWGRIRDIFYLASYSQRPLLSYYRSSLTRTENKCLFLPHLWELSFPEQNAVIIPDLPSVRRTRASDTVWKVKCVCVRLWKSEISDWGRNEALWTEAGLWRRSSARLCWNSSGSEWRGTQSK